VRPLFTSFFLEGLREVAHLTDLSLLIAGQPRGSTPCRRPPLSWACHRELRPGLLLLSAMHVELQRRRWSLCTRWRSSSSSALIGRHHRTSLLHPSSLSAVYDKRWCKWTPLSYSSHPPLHVEPTLIPTGDREHQSGEHAPPCAAVRHRVSVSRQAGPRWAVRTEQACRVIP
jgi:hypothetical protein